MTGLTYINTKSNIPRFTADVYLRHARGFAYETDTHFIHTFGRNTGFNIISIGLTALQAKEGTLKEWVENTFGAIDIKPLNLKIGNVVKSVWRPTLYHYEDTFQALDCNETDMRLAEQSLRLLIGKLDELFLYIEPDAACINTFSHKTRELLILACAEVENSWTAYMDLANATPVNRKSFTTKDYVKLCDKLHLRDYQFTLKSYKSLGPFRPFNNWQANNPSTSLDWYDAYNKTKHDRSKFFSTATLNHCISAVVATLVMHCVRFSPIPMFEDKNMFSALITQHFQGELIDTKPETFYLHEVKIPANTRKDLFLFNPREQGWTQPFKQEPLTL
ncbi:hypothetical protein [Mucilaginibacter sp. dw_454]|uniref:hypothetical protein n=1 Tax=Mucilaginibacter sp. dw_454 TaxID=2720079 RepID=UPI001BD6D54A|nr:hypothetical protein [Mucilaginibacter sp. dw_454]